VSYTAEARAIHAVVRNASLGVDPLALSILSIHDHKQFPSFGIAGLHGAMTPPSPLGVSAPPREMQLQVQL
jgi:hypothetical protein